MSAFKKGTEAVQNVDLPLKEHHCIEVLEDISGNYYGKVRVCLPQYLLKLLLETIGIWGETAEEKPLSLEWLFLFNAFFLLVLDFFHFGRVVVSTLSEEEDLFVAVLFHPLLQVVGNLIVGYPVFDVFLAITIAHDLVVLLQLHPPPAQDGLHGLIDVGGESKSIEGVEDLWSEGRQVGEVFSDGAGDEPADTVGSSILIGQLLHGVGVLIDRHQLVDVHVQRKGLVLLTVVCCFLIGVGMGQIIFIMDIRVRNSDGQVESRHYSDKKLGEELEGREKDDLGKLLAVKRDLLLRGPEIELQTLSKNNQMMRKALQQVKEICLAQTDSPERKLALIASLLKKY